MEFLSGLERAQRMGVSAEDFKRIWEAEMRQSKLDLERQVLELRRANHNFFQNSDDKGENQLMEYLDMKFEELREEISQLRMCFLQTQPLHMYPGKLESLSGHHSYNVDDGFKTGKNENFVASTNIQNMNQTVNGEKDNSDNSTVVQQEQQFSPEGDIINSSEAQDLSIWTQEEDTDWQTVGHSGYRSAYNQPNNLPLDEKDIPARFSAPSVSIKKGGANKHKAGCAEKKEIYPNSATALGPYAAHISYMMSHSDSGTAPPEKPSPEIGKRSQDAEIFTLHHVQKMFATKRPEMTEYYHVTQPVKCKYKLQFHFNGDHCLEVKVFVSPNKGDEVQSPIQLSCEGEIYNATSGKYTQLWSMDTIAPCLKAEREFKASVCLSTVRGIYPKVTFDALSKRHYDRNDRFDFRWTFRVVQKEI